MSKKTLRHSADLTITRGSRWRVNAEMIAVVAVTGVDTVIVEDGRGEKRSVSPGELRPVDDGENSRSASRATAGLEHAGVATAAACYFAVIEALPINVLAAGSGCLLFSLMFRRSSFCESALRIASS